MNRIPYVKNGLAGLAENFPGGRKNVPVRIWIKVLFYWKKVVKLPYRNSIEKPLSCKMVFSNQFGVFMMMPPYHPVSSSGEGAGRTKKVKINCICIQICVA